MVALAGCGTFSEVDFVGGIFFTSFISELSFLRTIGFSTSFDGPLSLGFKSPDGATNLSFVLLLSRSSLGWVASSSKRPSSGNFFLTESFFSGTFFTSFPSFFGATVLSAEAVSSALSGTKLVASSLVGSLVESVEGRLRKEKKEPSWSLVSSGVFLGNLLSSVGVVLEGVLLEGSCGEDCFMKENMEDFLLGSVGVALVDGDSAVSFGGVLSDGDPFKKENEKRFFFVSEVSVSVGEGFCSGCGEAFASGLLVSSVLKSEKKDPRLPSPPVSGAFRLGDLSGASSASLSEVLVGVVCDGEPRRKENIEESLSGSFGEGLVEGASGSAFEGVVCEGDCFMNENIEDFLWPSVGVALAVKRSVDLLGSSPEASLEGVSLVGVLRKEKRDESSLSLVGVCLEELVGVLLIGDFLVEEKNENFLLLSSVVSLLEAVGDAGSVGVLVAESCRLRNENIDESCSSPLAAASFAGSAEGLPLSWEVCEEDRLKKENPDEDSFFGEVFADGGFVLEGDCLADGLDGEVAFSGVVSDALLTNENNEESPLFPSVF